MNKFRSKTVVDNLSCEIHGVFNRYAKDIRNLKSLYFNGGYS